MPFPFSPSSRVLLSLAGFYLLLQTACISLPEQSCIDGIKNFKEEAVDCGGDCPYCASCEDGVKNGQETDIDCGGPQCPVCHDCHDGYQNGDETGIDCGGAKCTPCSCTNNVLDAGETMIDCGGICQSCTESSCVQSLNYMTVTLADEYRDSGYTTSVSGSANPTFSTLGFTVYGQRHTYYFATVLSGTSPTVPSSMQYRFMALNPGSSTQGTYLASTMYVDNLLYRAVPRSSFFKFQYNLYNLTISTCDLVFVRNSDTVIVTFSQTI